MPHLVLAVDDIKNSTSLLLKDPRTLVPVMQQNLQQKEPHAVCLLADEARAKLDDFCVLLLETDGVSAGELLRVWFVSQDGLQLNFLVAQSFHLATVALDLLKLSPGLFNDVGNKLF